MYELGVCLVASNLSPRLLGDLRFSAYSGRRFLSDSCQHHTAKLNLGKQIYLFQPMFRRARRPLTWNLRVPDPLIFKGPGFDSISFHIPSPSQTCSWDTPLDRIRIPVCKSLVSIEGAGALKFHSYEFVSYETEGKSKPKSKAPPVTQRDRWATRKFKTAPKDCAPRPYEYHAKGADKYELCATFDRDNRNDNLSEQNRFWNHPQGHFCFALDPSQSPSQQFY
jgi:hypothetical protein